MKENDFRERVCDIARDTDKTVDERVGMMLQLRDSRNESDPDLSSQTDVDIFEVMLPMLCEQESSPQFDVDIVYAATMLAEAYVDLGMMRQMRPLAASVAEILREANAGETVSDELLNPLPRLLDAVRQTAYNHALRELLTEMIETVCLLGKPLTDYKREATELLKLNVLIGPDRDCPRSKALEHSLAGIFTPDELVGIIFDPVIGHLRRDPVEYTERWEDIIYDVEDELEQRFKGERRHMGFCYRFWHEKADLLREKYGIIWHSPAVMNPSVHFD